MKITIKGQVTIPKSIREQYGLCPGNEIRFVERDHCVILEKVQTSDVWQRYRGILKINKKTDEVIRALRGPRP